VVLFLELIILKFELDRKKAEYPCLFSYLPHPLGEFSGHYMGDVRYYF